MQTLKLDAPLAEIDFISGPLVLEEGGYTPSVGARIFDRVTETINAYFATDDPAEINAVLDSLNRIAYYAKEFSRHRGEVKAIPRIIAQMEGGRLHHTVLTGLSWTWRSPLGTGDEFSSRRGIAITIERMAYWSREFAAPHSDDVGHGMVAGINLFDDADVWGEVGASGYYELMDIGVSETTRPSLLIVSSIPDSAELYEYVAALRAHPNADNVDEVTDPPFYPTDTSPFASDKCAVLLNGDETEGQIISTATIDFQARPIDTYLVVARALLKVKSGGDPADPGDPLLTILLSLYTDQDAATDKTVQVVGQFAPRYDRTIYPVGVVTVPRVKDQPVELLDNFIVRLDYLGNVATKYDLYLDAIALVPLNRGILTITDVMQLAKNKPVHIFRNEAGLIHVAAPVQRAQIRESWLAFDANEDALLRRGGKIFLIGEFSYYDSANSEWKPPQVSCNITYRGTFLDLRMEE